MKKTNTAISLILGALCGVSVIALGACEMMRSGSDEGYTGNYDEVAASETSIQTSTFENQNSSDTPIVVDEKNVVEETVIINPYLEENTTAYVSMEEKKNACYQVKNGRVIPVVQPILDPSMGEPTPCGVRATQVPQPVVAEKTVAVNAGVVQKKVCEEAAVSGRENPECAGVRTAEYINIETPARCQIPFNEGVISSLPLDSNAFKMTRLDTSDALPRFEVNNYSFKNIPLDLAIQNLVSEAGIRVYSDDALFPDVSGDKIRGELSVVIDELTAAGDVYYRYDAQKKQLILSRWARFTLSVPGKRVGMYTVLDALRGANITNVHPDFGSNEIYMRINKEKFNTITKLIDTIKANPNLMLFDIQVYRLVKKDAKCPIDWQQLVQDFGVSRINTSVNGIMGRILAMKQQPRHYTLVDALRKYGSVNLISEGVAVMPDGWKVRFDIGQCAKFETPEQQLSMLFQSDMLANNRAQTNIALDTQSGEITSFHTLYTIGDSLNIVGISGNVFNPAWKNSVEYLVVLKPRLLKLVK